MTVYQVGDQAEVMPNPQAWPECPTCKTAWVLRRSFVIGDTIQPEWLWQRDCKHKAEPVLRRASDIQETSAPRNHSGG